MSDNVNPAGFDDEDKETEAAIYAESQRKDAVMAKRMREWDGDAEIVLSFPPRNAEVIVNKGSMADAVNDYQENNEHSKVIQMTLSLAEVELVLKYREARVAVQLERIWNGE